ncbi:MAG: FAD-binding protein [Burkholderiales bacterium]
MPGDRRSIVIVGHGAAGLSAAIAAAESSQASGVQADITMVDSAPEGQHGGNTRWSPSYMRMAAPDRVAPGFEEDILAAAGGRADPRYVRRMAREAPATIAWLQGHGIGFHRPTYYLSAGPPRIQPLGGGTVVIRELTRVAKAAGISMRYEHSAERLITNADGSIGGVGVKLAGGEMPLHADAVILACGGFQGNGAMLREHFGAGAESFKPISPGTVFNTGAGIRMALAAGASSSGDWNGMHAEPIDPRSTGSAPVVLVYPYGIVVDQTGRRFFDEGAGLVHETWETFARNIHLATPGRIAFAILDRRLYDIQGFERAIRSEVPPYSVGSIEALAQQAGISASGLARTIDAYNNAAKGDASRFDATRIDGLAANKSLDPPKSNWARPINAPPYLAYPLIGGLAYTFGGIATDEDARVLGARGPIPGLYAAGEITGHFYGLAPNAVAMIRALVFGRIAGQQAVGSLDRGRT